MIQIMFEPTQQNASGLPPLPKELPIIEYLGKIAGLVQSNDVLILEGDTGSGKSTQVPKFLMTFYNKIICTEP